MLREILHSNLHRIIIDFIGSSYFLFWVFQNSKSKNCFNRRKLVSLYQLRNPEYGKHENSNWENTWEWSMCMNKIHFGLYWILACSNIIISIILSIGKCIYFLIGNYLIYLDTSNYFLLWRVFNKLFRKWFLILRTYQQFIFIHYFVISSLIILFFIYFFGDMEL